MSCSAMPTLMRRSGNSFWNCTEVTRADAVVADCDDARIRVCEFDQRLGEGLTAIERFDLALLPARSSGEFLEGEFNLLGGWHFVVPLDPILDEGNALALDRVGDDAARLAGSAER